MRLKKGNHEVVINDGYAINMHKMNGYQEVLVVPEVKKAKPVAVEPKGVVEKKPTTKKGKK